MPGTLDGDRHRALVPGAGPKLPARFDLATFRQVPAEVCDVFVIHDSDPLSAEHADLATGREAATAASTAPAATALVVSAAVTVPSSVAPAAAAVPTAVSPALGATAEAGSVRAAARPTASRVGPAGPTASTVIAAGPTCPAWSTGAAGSGFLLCSHVRYLHIRTVD